MDLYLITVLALLVVGPCVFDGGLPELYADSFDVGLAELLQWQ